MTIFLKFVHTSMPTGMIKEKIIKTIKLIGNIPKEDNLMIFSKCSISHTGTYPKSWEN